MFSSTEEYEAKVFGMRGKDKPVDYKCLSVSLSKPATIEGKSLDRLFFTQKDYSWKIIDNTFITVRKEQGKNRYFIKNGEMIDSVSWNSKNQFFFEKDFYVYQDVITGKYALSNYRDNKLEFVYDTVKPIDGERSGWIYLVKKDNVWSALGSGFNTLYQFKEVSQDAPYVSFEGSVFVFKDNGKFGILTGSVVGLACEYDSIRYMNADKFQIYKGGKYQLFSAGRKQITEFDNRYDIKSSTVNFNTIIIKDKKTHKEGFMIMTSNMLCKVRVKVGL